MALHMRVLSKIRLEKDLQISIFRSPVLLNKLSEKLISYADNCGNKMIKSLGVTKIGNRYIDSVKVDCNDGYKVWMHFRSVVVENKLKENIRYVLIPHISSDTVLESFGIDTIKEYSILKFKKKLLSDVYILDSGKKKFHRLRKSDFSKGNRPRILQEPMVCLYAPDLYVKGLRELGYKADNMIYDVNNCGWLFDKKPTFDLEFANAAVEVRRTRIVEFMLFALENYDIFHTHSNWSMLVGDYLWEHNADLYFLKKMGKKIVSSFWGWCDVKLKDYTRPGTLGECAVCKTSSKVCCLESHNQEILRTFKYSDKMFSNGIACIAWPDIEWLDNPINTNYWREYAPEEIPDEFKLPETNKIRIYHSFANSEKRDDIKGQKYIVEAINTLAKEGYAVESMIFDKVRHADLKYYQAQADIIVDQLWAGWHGSTGVECLAAGKPVITYIEPIIGQYLKKNRDFPLLSANSKNIYDVLKYCITHMEEMQQIGKESRKYALKYHDYRTVVRQLADGYEKIYLSKGEQK